MLHTLTATEMLARLDSGDVSSVELVEALEARRKETEPSINAFVHVNKKALEDAKLADEARANGDAVGALHGLPITIKDNIDVVGTAATLGLESRKSHRSQSDAVLVKALRGAGAIILGKTNIPQLLLAQESENSIYGVTSNPWNLDRVPGGSSGGEAAAVAAGSSPLGIGTDIGGSIRIPAHFCGIAGLKPTLDRWSNRGSNGAMPGQELVRAQIGALARTTQDLVTVFRALDPADQAAMDPLVPPFPIANPADIDLSGMRIGVFGNDGFIPPLASLDRALNVAVGVLEDLGATVVEHTAISTADIVYTWLGGLTADGGRTIDKKLAGESISPQLKPSRILMKLPNAIRKTAAMAMRLRGEDKIARLLECMGEKTVDKLWDLTEIRTNLRRYELDAWNREQLDAVVCLPHVTPALPHRESGDFTLSAGAEFRWTLLNFPAGIVPVTTVESNDVGHYAHAEEGRLERKVDMIDRGSYGLPVGVQVVGRPFREDIVLGVMSAIEDALRHNQDYPTTPIDPRK